MVAVYSVRAGHHQIRPGKYMARPGGPKNEGRTRRRRRDWSSKAPRGAMDSRARDSSALQCNGRAGVWWWIRCVWRERDEREGRDRNEGAFIETAGERNRGGGAAVWSRRGCGRDSLGRGLLRRCRVADADVADSTFWKREGPWPKMPRQPRPLDPCFVALHSRLIGMVGGGYSTLSFWQDPEQRLTKFRI
jgi:hypothetical protein